MWSEQWQKIDLNRYKDEVKQDELPVFHRLVDPLVGCNWRRIWIALHCSSELLRSVDDARTFSHLMNYGGRLDSEASIQDKDSNRFFEKGRRFFFPGYYLLLTKKQDNSEFWCPMRVQIVRESQGGIFICVSVRVLVQKRRIQRARTRMAMWACPPAKSLAYSLLLMNSSTAVHVSFLPVVAIWHRSQLNYLLQM